MEMYDRRERNITGIGTRNNYMRNNQTVNKYMLIYSSKAS